MAAHQGRDRGREEGARRRAAPSWSRSRPTRSTRCGTTARRRPTRASSSSPMPSPASPPPPSAQDVADWLTKEGADAVVLSALDSIAWAFNVRGQDVSRTPVALAYALINADATADLFVAPEKIDEAVATHLGNAVRLHPRDAFAGALDGARRQARDGRSRARRRRDLRPAGPYRRDDPRGARSGRAAQGDQERGRDRRHHGGACPRRRGRHPFPPLGRHGGGQGRRGRADRRRQARGVPRRNRRAQGSVVRHHLGLGPQWRGGALPRLREDGATDRGGHALPRRFGRPICRRHHRHHPHRVGRHADARR